MAEAALHRRIGRVHVFPFPPWSSQRHLQHYSLEVLHTVPCFRTLVVKEVASEGALAGGLVLSFEGLSGQNATHLRTETKKMQA